MKLKSYMERNSDLLKHWIKHTDMHRTKSCFYYGIDPKIPSHIHHIYQALSLCGRKSSWGNVFSCIMRHKSISWIVGPEQFKDFSHSMWLDFLLYANFNLHDDWWIYAKTTNVQNPTWDCGPCPYRITEWTLSGPELVRKKIQKQSHMTCREQW